MCSEAVCFVMSRMFADNQVHVHGSWPIVDPQKPLSLSQPDNAEDRLNQLLPLLTNGAWRHPESCIPGAL